MNRKLSLSFKNSIDKNFNATLFCSLGKRLGGRVARTCDPKEPFVKVPVRLIKSDKLTVYEKMVFIFISSFNPSFPSIRLIAKRLGISTSTVYHSIERLCEIGVLIRKSGDNSTSNRYNSHWGVSLDDTGVSPNDTHVYRQAIPNQIKESDQLIIAKEISKIGGLAAQARCHSFYSKCLLRDDKVTKERVIACTQAFAELPRR